MIQSIQQLATQLDDMRQVNLPLQIKIVHAHGCFDLLHIGHIRHLKAAKALGDVLVATITPDIYVNKGEWRPAFPQDQRAEAVAALRCVDYVVINEWPTAVEAIHLLRPNVFVKGIEYKTNRTPMVEAEEQAVLSCDGRLEYIGETVASSTKLLEKSMGQVWNDYQQEARTYRVKEYGHDPLGSK